MKLSDYVINFLVSKNVRYIFEVCGGAIIHLLDSSYGRKDISVVSMHHEQAAAFAAEGYARIKGGVGVAMATSGPGATNFITGIGSCFFDSIPCLFITGQVNTYEYKFDKPVRQIGFQETDIVSIVKPIVKDAVFFTNPDEIKYVLQKLISCAESGRPGPVLLDIPMNVQRSEINAIDIEKYCKDNNGKVNYDLRDGLIKQIVELIKTSSRPLILVGGGVRLSAAQDVFETFAHKTGIPVVCSLMGLDAFPHNDPLFIGMIGTYGNRYANLAIANADLVLAFGTRLDTRQTGTKPETFARGAKVIHVDIDPNELNNKLKVDYAIHSDLKVFLTELKKYDIDFNAERIKQWIQIIYSYKKKYPSYKVPTDNNIDPNYFMNRLVSFVPDDAIICTDIGQNQMWAAQSLEIKKGQRFLTQGGMGAMGGALPMAIGASFAEPNKKVVVITGDGGFQLNIQELQTIYHHRLPIKIILLNNNCYGMVRQFQKQYFNSKFQSTVIGYSCPNFQAVVSAYKIPTNKINNCSEIDCALKELFNDTQPRFLELDISINKQVLPKLSVNKPLEDQEPLLSQEELRNNMIIDVLSEEIKK